MTGSQPMVPKRTSGKKCHIRTRLALGGETRSSNAFIREPATSAGTHHLGLLVTRSLGADSYANHGQKRQTSSDPCHRVGSSV